MNYSSTKKSKIFSTLLLSIFLIQTFVQPVYAYLTYSPVVIYNPYEPLFSPLSADDVLVSPSFTNASKVSNEEIVVHENQEETFNSVKKKENVEKIQIEKVITPASTIAFIASEDTYGWIGNHPSKGADDPSDNLFSFQLSEKDFHQKQMVLKAEVKGVANTSGLAISINENISTGGYYISKNSDWNTIEIPMDTRQLRVGTNHIMFSLPAHATAAYEIKNPQLVFKATASNTLPYALVDGHHLYVKDGKAYIKGYLFDRNVSVYIEGVLAKKTGSYFEAFVPANEQTQFLTIEIQSSSETQQYQHAIKHISLVNQTLPVQAKPSSIAIQKATDEEYWEINTEELQFKIHPDDYAKIADIQVSKLRAIDVPALGQNIINVTAHAPAYRFLPEGAVFNKEVGLTLSYDPQKLPKGYTEKDIQILYFNVDQRRWLTIPTDTIDAEQHFITGLTNHFTDYIAGVIQAPESPETNSFTPTSISDIQVANPVANIVQIEPPTANQKGDANVQFPFTLPPGRNGLQPSLGLSYNNNGSSGIAGYGWDLSIPSITVDTKFGVPAFDAATESETYLFNGEELLLKNGSSLYLSHREANAIPRVSNATFYPKVEGSFSKIQRLGTNPSNYSWVVYDKSGMKYYYGSTNDSKITTDDGKINKWMLKKVEDKDGNYISYHYFDKYYYNGNLSNGKELCLDYIVYNLHDDLDNDLDKYVHLVSFKYKEESRPDTFITYRNGFKEVSASYIDRIKAISISKYDLFQIQLIDRKVGLNLDIFNFEDIGEHIVEYQFNYQIGQFNKLLLKSINTINKKVIDYSESLYEEESYSHEFDYYNDIENGLFLNGHSIYSPKDLDVSLLEIDLPLTNLDLSMLSASYNKNVFGGDVDFGAGIYSLTAPPTFIPFSFSGTFNMSYPIPSSITNKPVIQLFDIDGDGFADKVIKTNDGIKYRKNIGGTYFSEELYDVINMDDISVSRSVSKNYLSPSVSAFFISKGFSKNKVLSEVSTFLTDANADGLIDYVKDGKVYFGRINPNSGLPTFTANSLETPNVIYKEGEVDESVLSELPDLSLGNDLMDIVKVWVAPKSGYINIKGTITKNFLGIENGIRYSIEKTGKTISHLGIMKSLDDFGFVKVNPELISSDLQYIPITEISNSLINSMHYIKSPTLMVANSQSTNFNNIYVNRGEMIFFRVNNSQVPIQEAQVTWDPEIIYTTENFDSPNGYKQYSSKYSDALIYGNSYIEPIMLSENGTYKIQWDSFIINNSTTLAELSDDVKINVYLYKHQDNSPEIVGALSNQTSPILYSRVINRNTINNISNPNQTFTLSGINQNDNFSMVYLKIEVETKSQINWKKFDQKFKPKLINVSTGEIKDINAFYEVYKNQITNYSNSFFTNSTNVRIYHNFDLAQCNAEHPCGNQEVYLVAKDINGKIPNKISIGGSTYPIKIKYTLQTDGTVLKKEVYDPSTQNYTKILTSNYSDVTFVNGQKIFFEYYTKDSHIATKINNYQNSHSLIIHSNGQPAHSNYNVNQPGVYKANIFYSYNMTGMGTLYRNWGQFAYKGAAPNTPFTRIQKKYIGINSLMGNVLENPTQEELENMEDFMNDTESINDLTYDHETGEFSSNNPNFSINEDQIEAFKHFTMLKPNRSSNRWQAHNKLYVGPTAMSPYLRYENSDDLETIQIPTPQFDSEYGAVSIIQHSTSSSESETTSFSFSYVSNSDSSSKGTNKGLNAYMDVNGDGYPDIVGEKVQLTTKRGGLSQEVLNYSLLTESKISGAGKTLGGSASTFNVQNLSNSSAYKSKNSIKLANANAGGSGSGFISTSLNEEVFLDINGDGLPDRIAKNGVVYFNTGSSFVTSTYSGYSDLAKSITTSLTLSSSDGVSFANNTIPSNKGSSNFDISGGIFGTTNTTNQKSHFYDINGDGLVDYISNKRVYINTGTRFVDINKVLGLEEQMRSISVGLNVNASVNILIPTPWGIGVKFGGGGGLSKNNNFDFEKVRFMDFDGDGHLDIVTSNRETSLTVSYSAIRRTNMLKTISNPTGSRITLNYSNKNQLSNTSFGNTFKMPFRKWVISSVEIYDGFEGDGADVQKYAFEYKNGFKDRRERKFLGFGEVLTHSMREDGTVFRTSVQEYMLNSLTDYEAKQPSSYAGVRKQQYLGHLPVKQYTIDAIGRVLNETYTEYYINNLTGNNPTSSFNTLSNQPTIQYGDKNRILPLVKSTKNIVYNYQGNSTNSLPYISNAQFLLYDKIGNVLRYKDVEENLVVDITYHEPLNNVYISIPSTHQVSQNGVILRRTTTNLDSSHNYSSISRLKLNSENEISTINFEYDNFGLLKKVIQPKPFPNSSESDRMYYQYTYDQKYDMFITKVQDANEYVSTNNYTNFGLITQSRDLNGNVFNYTYDATRRLIEMKGPYHSNWTINHQYNVNSSGLNYAITKHNLTDEQGENIEEVLHTSIFADGLGRVLQTKKQLDVNQVCEFEEEDEEDQEQMGYWFHISGKVIYDEFGRTRITHLGQEEMSCTGEFMTQLSTFSDLNHIDSEKSVIDYDILDRPIQQQVVGLNAITQFEYGFDDDGFGIPRYYEKTTLPEGNISVVFKDRKGRTSTTRQIDTDSNEILDTNYKYSSLNELINVTDAEGHQIVYKYDKLGNMIQSIHPDRGVSNFTYDLSGKLVKFQDQNLINNAQEIVYNYQFNHLLEIIYPSHEVSYKYGTSADFGNGFNQVGRLKSVHDLTGTRSYSYGSLGEIVEDDRLLITLNDTLQFTTMNRYDSWGRIKNITYPDGEEVEYIYNSVGQLKQMNSSDGTVYLKDIKYTFYEQPYEIIYGNDVKTTNYYDQTQRLRGMQLDRPSGSTFMQAQYDYDLNQNIVGIRNNVSQHETLRLGGVFDKVYTYDKFNRLSTAVGQWNGFEEYHDYSLEMHYNKTHGIVKKIQSHNMQSPDFSGETVNNYLGTYLYENSNQPHAPSAVEYANGNTIKLYYDSNGNLSLIESNSDLVVQGERKFTWDEQNRLLAVNDNDGSNISHYVYDHAGERTFKSEGGLTYAHIGGQQIYEVESLGNYLVYPSGYLVFAPSRKEYTKHYYIADKKISSRIMEWIPDMFVANETSGVTPLAMSTFSNQDPNHCLGEIQTMLNFYVGPQWEECRNFINSVVLSHDNPCEAVEYLNSFTCAENPIPGEPGSPGSPGYPGGPYDPSDPVYSPEEINQFDCLNELNLLLNELSVDFDEKEETCYSLVVRYVQYNLVLSPVSNACEVLEYLDENFECINRDIYDEGHLDIPSDPIYTDDLFDEIPEPSPESPEDKEDVFEESERSSIWWYHSDHLGSSSYLTDNFGRPTHYYDQLPFGESMVEHNQSQYYGNQYKFNGKELDAATGMYYYGARYYDPRLSIFISVDPLAEQFVGWTPYHYVHQNPINLIDPTGMSAEGLSPIFGSDGEYRGNTSEGYTGNILIYDGDINDLEGTSDRSVKSNFEEQIIFSKYSEANMLQVGAKKMDDVRQSMSGDALSKIYTHVASQLSGTIINGCVFNINDLEGGKIHHGPPFNPQKPSSWETYGRVFGNKGWNDKIVGTNRYLYESTVENLQSSIVYHEWWGHIANPFSSKEGYNNHSKAIEAVMNSPLWEKTTPKYKEINQRIYKQMKKDESKRK